MLIDMKKKPVNFISIDVGSSKIASIAANISRKGDVEILGQNLNYSEGIKSGMIIDISQAENSLLQSIYALEQECEDSITEAIISLPGYGTKSYYIHDEIKILGNKITKNDVQKLIQKNIENFNISDSQIIHYFPIEFTIEAGDVVEDPVGMYSSKLGCKMHIVSANSNMLMNLANCFNKCQVEVGGVVLGIYASSIACLTDDEKKLGSLVIDFGARTTSFAIFVDSKMIYSGYVPIGGWHVTSDIAKAFSIDFHEAEKLKILYGSVSETVVKSTSVISIEDSDENEINITLGDLVNVIIPRLDEILELIKEQYDKINIDHLISRKVVLTGGGAMLKGLKEKTCLEFSKQVRIAKPKILSGFAEDYNPGIFSSAIGVVEAYANRLKKNHNPMSEDYNAKQHWGNRILSWIRENI